MQFKKEHGIIIGFVTILVVPLVAGIFVHNDYSSEKRTPASFPTAISNSYFSEINDWYSDHSPFRTGMININDFFTKYIEEPFRNWLVELDINYHQSNHEHIYSEWIIEKDATEEENGLRYRTCTICDKREEEIIPMIPHVHTYSTEWSYDGYEHWHAATCAHSFMRDSVESHAFGETLVDNENREYHICSICGCLAYIEQEGEHVHAFSSAWSNDETHHWHKAVCEHKDLTSNYEEHLFGSWHPYDESQGLKAQTCSVCGYDKIVDINDKLEMKIDDEEFPYYPYEKANSLVLYGRDNWLFYLGDKSMDYYKGTNVMSEADRDDAIKKMQRLQNICDKKGFVLIFVALPNKDAVYSDKMPTVDGRINALKRGQQFNNYIQYNTDFNYIYPLEILKEGRSTYPTYYMQDTHWNRYGGYLAAKEVFRRMNWDFSDDVNLYEQDWTGGDLAAMVAGSAVTYSDPIIDYRSDVTYELTTSSSYMEKAVSSNKNGRKLLLSGDSYRTSMSQYFIKEVETSLMFHRSRVNPPKDTTSIHYQEHLMFMDYIKTLNPGDIVICSWVERLDNDAIKKIDNLAARLEKI